MQSGCKVSAYKVDARSSARWILSSQRATAYENADEHRMHEVRMADQSKTEHSHPWHTDKQQGPLYEIFDFPITSFAHSSR